MFDTSLSKEPCKQRQQYAFDKYVSIKGTFQFAQWINRQGFNVHKGCLVKLVFLLVDSFCNYLAKVSRELGTTHVALRCGVALESRYQKQGSFTHMVLSMNLLFFFDIQSFEESSFRNSNHMFVIFCNILWSCHINFYVCQYFDTPIARSPLPPRSPLPHVNFDPISRTPWDWCQLP